MECFRQLFDHLAWIEHQRLSLWDNWGDERGCDEGHWHAHTRGLPWGHPEVVGTVQQVHYSRRRLLRRGLSIKVPIRKKYGNLFNDPRVYIYIYIYANFIEHNRHFMPTYSVLDPFEFPYYFYRIRGELIKVLSIIVCIPSTFCPTLGHHQGRICNKSDVTFVLANYYCVRTSLLLEIMALAFKCNSVNSASS